MTKKKAAANNRSKQIWKHICHLKISPSTYPIRMQ